MASICQSVVVPRLHDNLLRSSNSVLEHRRCGHRLNASQGLSSAIPVRSQPLLRTRRKRFLCRSSLDNSAVDDGKFSNLDTMDPPRPSRSSSVADGPSTSSSTKSGKTAGEVSSVGKFRSGQRRAEVRLPGLLLEISAADVTQGGASVASLVDNAVAGGATMVVLTESVGSGGGALYEAACSLRTLVRGRAALLIANRADIAAVAGADGVLLTDKGLPAVVARRMIQNVGSGATGVLPLVARSVTSLESATAAAAGDGADLLILDLSAGEDGPNLIADVRGRVSIPVIAKTSEAPQLTGGGNMSGNGEAFLKAGADGLLISLTDLQAASAADDARLYVAMLQLGIFQAMRQRSAAANAASTPVAEQASAEAESAVVDSKTADATASAEASTPAPTTDVSLPVNAVLTKGLESAQKKRLAGALDILDMQARQIVEDERVLVTAVVKLLKEAMPEMAELSLLEDALKQLDEPFLLVIVGEFNSGKSSFINALLGKRYQREGVVPTTNEITLLKHNGGRGGEGEERSETHPDGHILRYLPASLLTQMNLVDTPGTNVILERQQRLTEEFVPRADLVLFVLSADRPLTESEVSFLRYIKQWGKKVIFILNKADVLEEGEVAEVMSFVTNNTQKLLGVEDAVVYPVSARKAMKAKLAATSSVNGQLEPERLAADPLWASSGFEELETFIIDFLGNSSGAGAERVRLKLDTPLGVGAALMEACERQLEAETASTNEDLEALASVSETLDRFGDALEKESFELRQRIAELVRDAEDRADRFIDSVLNLSNFSLLAQYLTGGRDGRKDAYSSLLGSFEKDVVGSTVSVIRRALIEHEAGVASSVQQQLEICRGFVKERWPGLSEPAAGEGEEEEGEKRPAAEAEGRGGGGGGGQKRAGEHVPAEGSSYSPTTSTSNNNTFSALATLEGFDMAAAMLLLEEEVRQVVMNTALSVGAAGASASLLTTVLPSTAEDLLALGLCSAGGYVGVLSLPLRGTEIKAKMRTRADSLLRQIEAALSAELREKVDDAKLSLDFYLAPYRKHAQGELERVQSLQAQFKDLDARLQALRETVQRLG